MKQLPLQWQTSDDAGKSIEVVLEAETRKVVVALMASALLAVVFDATETEEAADDR